MCVHVYLEAEDDGPDKAQGEAVVPIHDVMGTNIFQVNPLFFKELQGFVNVFQAVDPHATSCRPRLKTEDELLLLISKPLFKHIMEHHVTDITIITVN